MYGRKFTSFTYYTNDFWHKRKIDNCDPYNVLDIVTNIPVLIMTAFVLRGHILSTNTNKDLKYIQFEVYYKCMLITSKLTSFSQGYSV